MRTGSESSPRFTRPRAVAAAAVFLALLALAASSLLNALSVSARLSESGAARAALRLSTELRSPAAYDALVGSSAPVFADAAESDAAPRFESLKRVRDERLILSAQEWLAADDARPSASKRHDVVAGLARWDVDESLAAAFFETRSDAAAFESADRASFREKRATSERSSRDAAAALSALADGPADDALDDALAFLNELGAADAAVPAAVPAAPTPEASMLTSFFLTGDPVDSAGYVAACDAAAPVGLALASRLCSAASRLFFLLILGAIPLASVPAWSAALQRVLTALSRRFGISPDSGVLRVRAGGVVPCRAALGFLSTVRLLN